MVMEDATPSTPVINLCLKKPFIQPTSEIYNKHPKIKD